MVAIGFVSDILNVYNSFLAAMPPSIQSFVNLFLLVLLVVVYAVFIWKFYQFIARKNIFRLNLNQYNHVEHPGLAKILASSLYLLEYIIILPFVIFFWFAVFTLFLVLLTNSLSLNTLLVVSVIIIASVRMTSYIPGYGENLAKEIAKLLPLNLLAIALIGKTAFSFEGVISNLSEIPNLFSTILNYLFFIIVLEIILRLFDFLFAFFGWTGGPTPEGKNEKEKEK